LRSMLAIFHTVKGKSMPGAGLVSGIERLAIV